MIQNFSVIQQKHALICLGLCWLIFQSSYHTSLISPKQEIFETFASCSQINFPHFLWHFGKTKRSDKALEASCNGHDLYIGEVNVATKKIVIIKMSKMLYFQAIDFCMFSSLSFSDGFSNFEGFLMPAIGSYLPTQLKSTLKVTATVHETLGVQMKMIISIQQAEKKENSSSKR